MTKHETILQYLRKFNELVGGENIYKAQLESIKCVEVSKCTDVLTKEQIRKIRRIVKPRKHKCYKNAFHVAEILGFEYCEGYLFDTGFPIEHAFNKVGDKYIDVTVEFALKEDPTTMGYATIGEYDNDTRWRVADETQVYGGVFDYLHRKQLSKTK